MTLPADPPTATGTVSTTDRPNWPEWNSAEGPDTVALPVPLVGTFRMSRRELGFVVGIGALAALGLLEWPIALVMAGGQALAADRATRTIERVGRPGES